MDRYWRDFFGLFFCVVVAALLGCSSSTSSSPEPKPEPQKPAAQPDVPSDIPPPPPQEQNLPPPPPGGQGTSSATASGVPSAPPPVKLDEPEETLMQFLVANLSADKESIEKLTVADPNLSELWAEEYMTKEQAVTDINLLRAKPIKRLKLGDTYVDSSGKVQTVGSQDVSNERILIDSEEFVVPFIAIRADGIWKIDTKPLLDLNRKLQENKIPPQSMGGKMVSELPELKADSTLLDSLGEETTQNGLVFRIPKGYKKEEDQKESGKLYWCADENSQGYKPRITYFAYIVPSWEKSFCLERHFEHHRNALSNRGLQFSGDTFWGRIGNMPVVRENYQATVYTKTNQPYVLGGELISIQYRGMVATWLFLGDNDTSKKVFEASVFSVKPAP